MNRKEIIERKDINKLAKEYSLTSYNEDFIYDNLKKIKESEPTQKKMKENNIKPKEEGNFVYYCRSHMNDSILSIPTRGVSCTHSETMDFPDFLKAVALKKQCPICGKELKINEILIDTFLFDILEVIKANEDPNFQYSDFISVNTEDYTWEML